MLPNNAGADWAAVARDYAAGALTVAEICALHGIAPDALYRRARRDNWTLRAAATPRNRRNSQRDLAQRLLIALDQKMSEFETRMSAGATTTAADSERDARTLNTLVRLFDKLKGFGDKSASRAKSAPAPTATETHSHDADRRRHDLAQRLEKLRQGLGG